jgi:hypothetical protein
MATHQQEKEQALGDERIESNSPSDSDDYDARIQAFSEKEQKKIIRRIDRRLVLTLAFMYCVSLMDRTNLCVVSGPAANVY